MMSGERYQVIIDFAGYQAGMIGPNGLPYSGNWLLKNTGQDPISRPAPRRLRAPPARSCNSGLRALPGPTPASTRLRLGATVRPAPMVRLANPATGTVAAGVTVQKNPPAHAQRSHGHAAERHDPVTGVMTAYPGGPLEILVNNTKWNGERINGVMADPMTGHMMYTFESRPDFTLDGTGKNWLSELPNEGETEIWEIVNLTADAHPIHLHLVQFQLLNRQKFDLTKYNAAYTAAFPGGGYDPMTGLPYPPESSSRASARRWITTPA